MFHIHEMEDSKFSNLISHMLFDDANLDEGRIELRILYQFLVRRKYQINTRRRLYQNMSRLFNNLL